MIRLHTKDSYNLYKLNWGLLNYKEKYMRNVATSRLLTEKEKWNIKRTFWYWWIFRKNIHFPKRVRHRFYVITEEHLWRYDVIVRAMSIHFYSCHPHLHWGLSRFRFFQKLILSIVIPKLFNDWKFMIFSEILIVTSYKR